MNFVLVGGASLLLGDQIEASVVALLLGSFVAYLFSVPLMLECKYKVHGDRPKPPYTIFAMVEGDIVGRSLAGAIGFGLLLRPHLAGALLGVFAGLIITADMLIWLNPWDKDREAEIARRRSEWLREG